MAILTKKDLLEAIEDMPMDTIVQLETDLWVLEDIKGIRYYEEENRVVLSFITNMLTEKDYCDYDTCVALKELGYKGISRFFYATKESPLRRYSYDQILTTRIADAVGHTLAISLYSAQKWLREKHDMYVHICRPHMKNGRYVWSNEVVFCGCGVSSRGFFLSYEEALSEGIKEAVKILKDM